MSTAHERQQLRQQMREQRAALDSRRQDEAASSVLANLMQIELFETGRMFAGYRSVQGEVNINGFLSHLIAGEAVVTVPRVVHDDLEFVRWLPGTPTRRGAFGIEEPVDAQVLDPARHDAVLAPLLAFDRTGRRLGQGRGFYDRCFARLGGERPRLIGIAHTFQEVEQIPAEPWDIPLDAVVTDTKVTVFRPRSLQQNNSANRRQQE